MQNIHSAAGSHYRNFGVRPGEAHVSAQMFAAHNDVSAAVSFAGDNRDLGNGCFRECEEDLCTVADNAVVLCMRTGHESRGVNKGDHGDVEGIAETHEAGDLIG